ncbi:MAG: FG-GAP-like repeat-containing protein [Rudaea sp.]
MAQTHIGAVGNGLYKNPYPDQRSNLFGSGVISGDFDGDGISDLAVSERGGSRLRVMLGAPWEVGDTGFVIKFVPTTITTDAHNFPMASGDFDGDGRDEIALGAYLSAVDGVNSAGRVVVMNRANNGTWAQQSEIRAGDAWPGSPQDGAFLGYSLAAGDFNGDGFDDLAIGIVRQSVNGIENAGAVMIAYGSSNGLVPNGAQLFNRSNDGLTFAPLEDDSFGNTVAAGDFDDDGNDDLAIGIPRALCNDGVSRSGAVLEMHGKLGIGITTAHSHIWRPGVQGIASTCASSAFFGASLAVGNFDLLDFHADLAIGAPYSDDGGAVHVVYGSDTGLSANGNQRFTPPDWPGIGSTNSFFGSVLAAGLLDRSCPVFCAPSSLAIGAPNTTVAGVEYAGAVWQIASGAQLLASTMRPIVANTGLRIGAPHYGDGFGSALAIGDFNDDGLADLAIGVPYYYDDPDTNAGAVQVLYQSDYIFVGVFDTNTQ